MHYLLLDSLDYNITGTVKLLKNMVIKLANRQFNHDISAYYAIYDRENVHIL